MGRAAVLTSNECLEMLEEKQRKKEREAEEREERKKERERQRLERVEQQRKKKEERLEQQRKKKEERLEQQRRKEEERLQRQRKQKGKQPGRSQPKRGNCSSTNPCSSNIPPVETPAEGTASIHSVETLVQRSTSCDSPSVETLVQGADEVYECAFCYGSYCADGEEWVKCACSRWVHERCMEEVYLDTNGEERFCPFW